MNTPVRCQLLPGVWLTTVQTKQFPTGYWSIQLLTPLVSGATALTSLLPHVLLQGTAHESDPTLLEQRLSALHGVALRPVVSKQGDLQSMGFHGYFMDDILLSDGTPIFQAAAELLGDLILRPATRNGRLRSDYTEKMQSELCKQIQAQQEDPIAYAKEQLARQMCGKEPYGLPLLGTLRQAETIRAAKLNKHYIQLLSDSRFELFYCGTASHRQVRQAWTEALMGLSRRPEQQMGEFNPICHPKKLRRSIEHTSLNHSVLALGVRTQTSPDSVDYPALLVINQILSHRLERYILPKHHLFSTQSVLEPLKGLLLILCTAEAASAAPAESEVLEQLTSLSSGEITAEELDSARRQVSRRLYEVMENQELLAEHYFIQSLFSHKLSPQELEQLVLEVSLPEVSAAAQRLEPDTIYLLIPQSTEA